MIEASLYVALCVYFEARGEPLLGKIAVAQVILNRAEKRKISVKEVIFQPYQFSWVVQGKRIPPINDWSAFLRCCYAVKKALDERLEGKTLDHADHYHADYVAPSWAKEMKVIKQIGRHIFYRS